MTIVHQPLTGSHFRGNMAGIAARTWAANPKQNDLVGAYIPRHIASPFALAFALPLALGCPLATALTTMAASLLVSFLHVDFVSSARMRVDWLQEPCHLRRYPHALNRPSRHPATTVNCRSNADLLKNLGLLWHVHTLCGHCNQRPRETRLLLRHYKWTWFRVTTI